MKIANAVDREAAEDLYFGQVVMIWSRWFVIAGAAILMLWAAPDERTLAAGTVLIVTLMLMNFFLHARQIAGDPSNGALVTLASLIDLVLITVMVVSWPGARSADSRYIVFYYPVVLAFALVFPPRLAIPHTVTALLLYATVSVRLEGFALFGVEHFEPFLMRVITLGAMGALGAYYWRIQRRRREEVMASSRGVSF